MHRYDEVFEKLGYMLERYECPAASLGKSAKHLEDAAFRQGFRGGFVDAGDAKMLRKSLQRSESLCAACKQSCATSHAPPRPRRATPLQARRPAPNAPAHPVRAPCRVMCCRPFALMALVRF